MSRRAMRMMKVQVMWASLWETRIGPAPAPVTADLEATRKLLLKSPWELGAENLDRFAWNPVLQPPGTTPWA
ncbi:hypothetical protein ACFV7R_44520 [Streptomyces sp. NPDC059866]|uniref:hypothetical protein n=1 Tax=Streptomyces sp. NPDC059866 TaxID=3346978 RepID=UPI00366A1557